MRHDEARRRTLAYEVQRLAEQGRSQRQIAAALGVARRTVRTLLAELEARRRSGERAIDREVGRRTPKPSKLDGFEEKVRGWLDKYPKLTAVRCHEKLRAEGYDGGYTIVRERLRALRHELKPKKPKATPVETAPGQRAEFDWSPYELNADLRVDLWNVTLRWSRAPSLAGETNQKQTTILRKLRAGFEDWRGVPRECMTDSMSGVVDRWERDEPVLNARFVDFAAHYGFRVLIAPRGCPQWKAVAERLFLFHEKNLLNGRTFHSLEGYRETLAWWNEHKKLDRPHPELRQPIRELLEQERAHLLPLPARPYDTRDVVVRIVNDYQRVQLDTNEYPVPAPIGARVYVCADVERIEICDQEARRLIEHERLPAGAHKKLPPRHHRRVRYDLDELTERVAGWGEAAADFARGVRKARRCPGPQLVRLLQLQASWAADDIVAAIEHALVYRCFDTETILRILETRFSPRRFEDVLADASRERIREVMRSHPISQRPLSSYAALQTGDRSNLQEDDGDGEDQDEALE